MKFNLSECLKKRAINLSLSIAPFLLSCSSLNNRVNSDILNCGSDFDDSFSYFIVQAPDGHRLAKDDIEVVDLKTEKIYENLSSKGCVATPNYGQFLIRSKVADWSQIVDPQKSITSGIVTLIDFSTEHITVACTKDVPITVSDNFSLDSILIGNTSAALKKSYQLDIDITNREKSFRRQLTVNYSDLNAEFKPFLKQVKEGIFDMKIAIRNLSLGGKGTINSCAFNIDQTPPSVTFQVNQRQTLVEDKIHQTERVAIIDPIDEISFNSADADTETVSYCLEPLDDNFLEKNVEKKNKWDASIRSLNCDAFSMEQIKVNRPLLVPKKSGFWSLRFFATDKFGNRSPFRNQIFHYYHKNAVEFINQSGLISVRNALYERNNLKATLEVLKAYKLFKNLPTRFERERVAPSILAGLLDVSQQAAVNTNKSTNTKGVSNYVLSPDENVLVGFQTDGSIGIWNARSLELKSTIEGLEYGGSALKVSHDNKRLYAVSIGGDMAVWDIRSGDLIHAIKEPNRYFTNFAIDDSEKFIISVTLYGETDVRDARTFSVLRNLDITGDRSPEYRRFQAIDISRDGKTFAISSRDPGEFRIWDVESGNIISRNKGHSNSVEYLKYSKDGLHIYSVSSDNTALKWDLKTGAIVQPIKADFRSSIWEESKNSFRFTRSNRIPIELAPDEKSFVFGSANGKIQALDLESNRIIFTHESPNEDITRVIVSPSGETIYASSEGSPIIRLELKKNLSEREMRPLRPDEGGASALTLFNSINDIRFFSTIQTSPITTKTLFREWKENVSDYEESTAENDLSLTNSLMSKDGKKIIATSLVGLELFDFEKKVLKKRLRPTTDMKAFSPDSKSFVRIDKMMLSICNADNGEVMRTTEIPPMASSVVVSDDGLSILIGYESFVNLYDHKTLELKHRYDGNGGIGSNLNLSEMGTKILSSNVSLQIWDADSEKFLFELKDDSSHIYSANLIDDSGTILTFGLDSSIKVWNASTYEYLTTLFSLERHSLDDANVGQGISAYNWSPDFKKFAFVDNRGAIKVFDYNIENLRSKICNRLKDFVSPELCE